MQNGKWEVYILGSDGKPVSRESWKVIYADSEETEKGNYTADKVFDLQIWVRNRKLRISVIYPVQRKVLRDKSESIKYIYQTVLNFR